MLNRLYIENLAVIKQTEVEFDEGMTVLTGETGAGKSVLIDAVNAVLGQRTSKDVVRHGTQKAYISAVFDSVSAAAAELAAQNGYDIADELVLSREIHSEGKTIARINGRPASVQLVQQLGELLITIHGQHDNQQLLNESRHMEILDSIGDYSELIEKYRASYHELKKAKKELEEFIQSISEREERLEMLDFQIREIESAGPSTGEISRLEAERTLILHSEKVTHAVQSVGEYIIGDGGIEEKSAKCARELEAVTAYHPGFAAIAAKFDDITYTVQDINRALSDISDSLSFDPGRQDEVEQRLSVLDKLRRKYGGDEESILAFLAKAKTEYGALFEGELHAEKLQEKFDALKLTTVELAKKLSSKRREAADSFLAAVAQQLSFLRMPNVKMQAEIERTSLTENGIDKVIFLISANPGEPPKSISKIASGGELSRIMLAIKSVITQSDGIPTLIFDEIDAGVSGLAANKIGVKLSQLSKYRQVVCVTHLAQIAAFADNHVLIEKSEVDGNTETTVERLSSDGRVEELARLLGGETITEKTRANAMELIIQAKQIPDSD